MQDTYVGELLTTLLRGRSFVKLSQAACQSEHTLGVQDLHRCENMVTA